MSLDRAARLVAKRVLARSQYVACRVSSCLQPANSGPLICAATVRNEIDVLDAWLAHLCAVFDRIIIYDHLSVDGTSERLRSIASALPKLDLRRLDDAKLDQSRVMTTTFQEVAATQDRGWLFFLDADEFILGVSGAELRRKLHACRGAPTVSLTWCNAYPREPERSLAADSHVDGWTEGPCLIRKTAVNLSHKEKVVAVTVGSHDVILKRRHLLGTTRVGRLLHLPIRSRAQLEKKLSLGLQAFQGANRDPSRGPAAHWVQMSNAGSTRQLRHLVYNYSCFDGDTLSDRTPPNETLAGRLSTLVCMDPMTSALPRDPE